MADFPRSFHVIHDKLIEKAWENLGRPKLLQVKLEEPEPILTHALDQFKTLYIVAVTCDYHEGRFRCYPASIVDLETARDWARRNARFRVNDFAVDPDLD